jgi:hypothetical protein
MSPLRFSIRPYLLLLAIAIVVLALAVWGRRYQRAGTAGDEFRPSKSVMDEARRYGLKRGPNR